MPLLLRPQLVMHWLVMHALAKDSPGWLGDVSVTDLPCVHAIYMEDHRRQTMDSCKKLTVPVRIYADFSAIERYIMYTGCYNYMYKGKLYVYKECYCV